MAIKKFNTQEEYAITPRSETESTISHIEHGNQIKIDGVNVVTTEPEIGDILYLDESKNKVFVKSGKEGELLNLNLIPSSWELVGIVFNRKGNIVKVLDKNESTAQWLACWQYAITAISSTDITISLRMSVGYGTATVVTVTLSSTEINQTTANEISEAVAAKAAEVGDTNPWWAWYDAEHSRIIVQTDTCINYQQYQVAGTGCTIALCVWEDMPSNSYYMRDNGTSTNYVGFINKSKFITYFSTSGRTPTQQEPLKVTSNTTPVKLIDFNQNEFCTDIKEAYKTYENYIDACFKIQYPQKYGVFSLMDAQQMRDKYGNSTAPTKAGSTIYKFPALHYGATINYDAKDLTTGNWHLTDVDDGIEYLEDDVINILINIQKILNVPQLANSNYYWFSRRYNVYLSWYFGGGGGTLNTDHVHGRSRVRGVTLLQI